MLFKLKLLIALLVGGLSFGFAVPTWVFAQTPSPDDCGAWGCFEVIEPLVGERSIDNFAARRDPLVSFVDIIIRFLVAAVVAVALIVIVAAGYIYMTAGGDGSKVQLAKTMIVSALAGIVLALGGFAILSTVSPQFTSEIEEPAPPYQECSGFQPCPAGQTCSVGAGPGGKSICVPS